MKLFPDTISIFSSFLWKKGEKKKNYAFLLHASGESLSIVIVPWTCIFVLLTQNAGLATKKPK